MWTRALKIFYSGIHLLLLSSFWKVKSRNSYMWLMYSFQTDLISGIWILVLDTGISFLTNGPAIKTERAKNNNGFLVLLWRDLCFTYLAKCWRESLERSKQGHHHNFFLYITLKSKAYKLNNAQNIAMKVKPKEFLSCRWHEKISTIYIYIYINLMPEPRTGQNQRGLRIDFAPTIR